MHGDWLDIGPKTQIEPGTARTLPVEGGEEELKGGTPLASASEEGSVSPGQTRVTIMGGHKD